MFSLTSCNWQAHHWWWPSYRWSATIMDLRGLGAGFNLKQLQGRWSLLDPQIQSIIVLRLVINFQGLKLNFQLSEIGPDGREVVLVYQVLRFMTFYLPLWGAILFNGIAYFQIIRVINNATSVCSPTPRSSFFVAFTWEKSAHKFILLASQASMKFQFQAKKTSGKLIINCCWYQEIILYGEQCHRL